ncbi:MAG: TonB-dependent receptor, partial [Chitinophagaceae bacterium]|nr:TonB-dependent receptor [Chitinophagaceae bacterium]
FFSQRNEKTGFTLLANVNRQLAYDVDDDDFSELPKSLDFTIAPKLFLYTDSSMTVVIGHTMTRGSREGGDMEVLKDRPGPTHRYFEQNETMRNTSIFEVTKRLRGKNSLVARQSVSFFTRSIEIPDYRFKGTQLNSYTDISYIDFTEKHTLISGLNLMYDRFREDASFSGQARNERNSAIGLYVQDTWDASERLAFENGLRVDLTSRYGAYFLPRVSMLIRISEAWSSRVTGGMGYKVPTMFTEQAEALQYQYIRGLDNTLEAEVSKGATADINFQGKLSSDFDMSINQMFFYTHISDPLVLKSISPGDLSFSNADGHTVSYGIETNVKLIFRHNWKVFAGYTLTKTDADWQPIQSSLPLVPENKVNLALIYEKHDWLKVGLEAYHTGRQWLSNGTRTPAFWELGFMVEKPIRNFSIFVNLENFTDQRQSKFKRVVNGDPLQPTFDEIWNHTEGFVFNVGLKFRW